MKIAESFIVKSKNLAPATYTVLATRDGVAFLVKYSIENLQFLCIKNGINVETGEKLELKKPLIVDKDVVGNIREILGDAKVNVLKEILRSYIKYYPKVVDDVFSVI